MVYNTNGTTGEGYYYWNGTLWTRFISGNSTPLSGTGVANKVAFWSSPTNLSQNTNFHWDNAATRLGIGNAAPGVALDVTGRITSSDHISTTAGNLHTNRGRLAFSNTATDVNHTIYNNNSNIDAEGAWDGMKMNVFAGLNIRVGNAGATSAIYVNNLANVGIGTIDPQSKLHVMGKTNIHQSGAGGGQNRFEGLDAVTSANGRAQLVLSSSYSDLVVASSQANDNHGSTISLAAYDPSNAASYRKWVINQGNWGARSQFLDFGYAVNISNPHGAINSGNTTFTLDGTNRRVGVANISPSYNLDVAGKERVRRGGFSLSNANEGQIEVSNTGSGDAFISFHREGVWGAHFGLASDNWFSTLGWSAGGGYTSMRVGSFVANGSASVTNLAGGGNRIVMTDNNGALYPLANLNGSGLGDNLGNHIATTTLNMNSQSITTATGLSFNNANPTISASSYFVAPGGAYFNSGTVYTEAAIQTRGGINNDAGTFGGDVSITDNFRIQGVVTGIQGQYPANNAIRMTPNFHFNAPAGNAMIVNWDNGAVGGGTQQFRVGNGTGTDQFYVRADGQFWGRNFRDLDDGGYGLDPNSTNREAGRIRGGTLHGPNPSWGKYLSVGSNGREWIDDPNVASVVTTNGNLHLDAASGFDTYINHYDGNNIYFGRGNNSNRALMNGDGLYLYDGWLRTHGANGLYFQDYGTGIHGIQADGGNYGSVSTYGNVGGWEGYSLAGRYVWMTDGSGGQNVGLYNDVDNYWYMLINRLATENGYQFMNSYTGGLNMRIQHTNGGNYASYDGDNNWDYYSDRRLKENIENENNILDRLLKLDVVNYDFIEQERTEIEKKKGIIDYSRKEKEIGFIAQDVEKYFPSLVSEATDDRYDFKVKALGYSSFGILAVGAIKELKLEKDEDIAGLNQKIADLNEEVEELRNLVNQLLDAKK